MTVSTQKKKKKHTRIPTPPFFFALVFYHYKVQINLSSKRLITTQFGNISLLFTLDYVNVKHYLLVSGSMSVVF